MNVLEALAPVNVYAMLDTIAEDCAPLAAAGRFLPLWDHVAENANGLLFISKFSESAFCLRHPAALALPRMAHLLSTMPLEYRSAKPGDGANSHVLIIGNHFPHKGSETAAKNLSQAFPTMHFVVVGGETAQHGNLTILRSGTIASDRMDQLIRDASIIVLPAHVEGFGLGLMHALAAKRPVVARRIPATEEILATLNDVRGVFLFDSDSDLGTAFRKAMLSEECSARCETAVRWSDWADKFAEFCLALYEKEDIFPRLQRRILAGDLLRRAAVADQMEVQSHAAPVSPQGTTVSASRKQLTLDHLMTISDSQRLRLSDPSLSMRVSFPMPSGWTPRRANAFTAVRGCRSSDFISEKTCSSKTSLPTINS